MKARILSLLLIVCILLPLSSAMILADEVNNTNVLIANYIETFSADGAPEKDQPAFVYHKELQISAIWNAQTLLLQFAGKLSDLTLQIGNTVLQIDKEGNSVDAAGITVSKGELLEIGIPLSSVGIALTEQEQSVAFKISNGKEALFDGVLRFSFIKYRKMTDAMFDLSQAADGHTLTKANGKTTWTAPAGTPGRSYSICVKNNILSNHTNVGVLEMTIDATSIPIFCNTTPVHPEYVGCQKICDGFAVGVNYDVKKNVGYSFNLTNIKNRGLCLVFATQKFGVAVIPLQKESGSRFRLHLEHDFEAKSVKVFVDTAYLGEVINLYTEPQWGSNTVNQLSLNLWTAEMPSDFELSVSDINVGTLRTYTNAEYLTENLLLGANKSITNISKDLTLPKSFSVPFLSAPVAVSFQSSREDIVDPRTGAVTPIDGCITPVTLTAITNGKEARIFDLLILGDGANPYRYLVKSGDTSPATGAGSRSFNTTYSFDQNNRSVILDMNKKARINAVRLRDSDEICRLTAESLTLWISDDNKTYTQVSDFSFLRAGYYTYLYNFDVDAQYVKVHYTHFDSAESDFYAPLEGILIAYYDKTLDAENYSDFLETTVTNSLSTPIYDEVVTLSIPELGLAKKIDSLRVLLCDKLLYHYVDKETLYVRVPTMNAGESLTLTLVAGAENAIDLANEEAVWEVSYGTRESFLTTRHHRWRFLIPEGTRFPNGEVAERELLIAWTNTIIHGSYDGGRTWFPYGKVADGLYKELDGIGDSESGGYIFDDETGRIFYETHCYNGFNQSDMSKSDCINKVLYSDDGGKTWQMADVLEPDTVDGITFTYMLSYSDGIKLSSYDGAGPNVDFVFPTGAQFNNHGAFCARVAYSRDGGVTWQYSQSILIYGDSSAFEGGMSEAWIMENEKGVLVLYCRCQLGYVNRFAMAYSYDNGLTWTAAETRENWEASKENAPHIVSCKLSSVYSSNTQPVLFRYDSAPIFLWGGNNALGGTSYIRNPLNVAVSHDGLETWENIQNLFSETPHENYISTHYITNPSVQQIKDDTLSLTFQRLMLDDDVVYFVSDFSDFLYRTKGAFDSFESASPRYEGWISYRGTALLSEQYASRGLRSMRLSENSLTSRSIPYFTKGTISLDIYATEQTSLTLALQPAFSVDKAKALATVSITGLKLKCGSKTLELTPGWNTVEVCIGDKATVSINEENSISLPLTKAVGEYICYAVLFADTPTYVDNFTVKSTDTPTVYVTETDKADALEVYQKIDALEPATLENVQIIEQLRAEVNALTGVQRLLLTNINKLLKAEYDLRLLRGTHRHILEKVDAVAPSCISEGWQEHWYCEGCDSHFADENATQTITLVPLPKIDHTWNDGEAIDGGIRFTCIVCNETYVKASSPDTPSRSLPWLIVALVGGIALSSTGILALLLIRKKKK